MPSVEVVFSPALFPFRSLNDNAVVVLVDVFRATSTIITALHHGAGCVVPVEDPNSLLSYAEKGYLTAGERNGIKLGFTDFGNSPLEFTTAAVGGRNIAISTTNGTQALEKVHSDKIVAGAFINIDMLARWLTEKGDDVTVLCAGQNGNFIMEDTLFAGAMASILHDSGQFEVAGDPALASINLWKSMGIDLKKYLSGGSHYKRLLELGYHKDIDYCLNADSAPILPVLQKGEFRVI
jgi:2-phosphosulfolactate phosphatase